MSLGPKPPKQQLAAMFLHIKKQWAILCLRHEWALYVGRQRL